MPGPIAATRVQTNTARLASPPSPADVNRTLKVALGSNDLAAQSKALDVGISFLESSAATQGNAKPVVADLVKLLAKMSEGNRGSAWTTQGVDVGPSLENETVDRLITNLNAPATSKAAIDATLRWLKTPEAKGSYEDVQALLSPLNDAFARAAAPTPSEAAKLVKAARKSGNDVKMAQSLEQGIASLESGKANAGNALGLVRELDETLKTLAASSRGIEPDISRERNVVALVKKLNNFSSAEECFLAVDDTMKFFTSPAAKKASNEALHALISPLRNAMVVNAQQ